MTKKAAVEVVVSDEQPTEVKKIVPVIEPIQPIVSAEPATNLPRGFVLLVKVDAKGNEVGQPFQIGEKEANKAYLPTGQYVVKKSPTTK